MKLENQVCSLELAKKLKELGVKQESLWWWEPALPLYPDYKPITNSKLYHKDSAWISCSSVSAFTVAELGEMLPDNVLSYRWVENYIAIAREDDNKPIHSTIDNTEANARAKMLIWLIEQGK